MSVSNVLHAWVTCLANNGIEHIYISPGSRNAPLIRAFVGNASFTCYSAIDERSAAFQALGTSVALKKPVALLCTSGTALLNYYPAITEAFYAGVPLLVISADRPAELIDQWEGQCIRQTDVFEKHLGPSFTLIPDDENRDGIAATTTQILDTLLSNKPVHVNVPLSEPLYTPELTLQKVELICTPNRSIEDLEMPEAFKEALALSHNILVLNGHSANVYHATTKGCVMLNDVVSNKHNVHSPRYWDALFLSMQTEQLAALTPDLLITTGTSIVSKPLRNWLRSLTQVKQWHIGRQTPLGNPFFKQLNTWFIDELEAFPLLEKQLDLKNDAYLNKWQKLEETIPDKLHALLKTDNELNEPFFLHNYFNQLPAHTHVHLANSSAVRYASWLGLSAAKQMVYGNRGTSGIDGCTSTAIGFAKHSENHVLLVTGDIAFFYDINAFWGNGEIPANLKIIVLNNAGGGIFSLIKGPAHYPDSFPFQFTAQKRHAASVCTEFNISYHYLADLDHLPQAIDSFNRDSGPALLEVFTAQHHNVAAIDQLKALFK